MIHYRRRPFRAAGLAALVLAAALHTAPTGAETVLRMANWLPDSHPIVRDMMRPWAEAVARETGGALTVEILKAPLGKPPAHFDIARNGIADLSYGVHGYTPGRFVLTGIAELPLQTHNAASASVAYWRTHEQHLAVADEHAGVVVLGVFVHGPGAIFNRVRPVTAPEDLSGLKLRIGGGVVQRVAAELGAVPVAAPATQAYELLSNGVADGILFPLESVAFFKLAPVVRHATLVPGGLYNTSFFFVMNQGRFDRLPEAQRAALARVSGETFVRMAGRAWDRADQEGLETLRAAKVRVTTLEGPALTALSNRVRFAETAWLKAARDRGIDARAALDHLRRELTALAE